MRVILSRKGFDSTAGGVASPILPDGTLVSLPIPDDDSPVRYRDVTLAGHDAGTLVSQLTRGAYGPDAGAHLDPDVVRSALPRPRAWRPLFGQAGAAQTVLAREAVGPGDVFVFFGWFRRVEQHAASWRFVAGAPDLHVLWGWMEIDRVIDVATTPAPRWARAHPHLTPAAARWTGNTLYVARDRLTVAPTRPGHGTFGRYRDALRLTTPGATRSRWTLPGWFAPGDRPPLGYHGDPRRWRTVDDRVELQSVARGQELVLDTAHYPEAVPWLRALVTGRSAARGR